MNLKSWNFIYLIITILIVLLFISQQLSANKQTFKYTNPITRDFSQSIRDNLILKDGKHCNMIGTSLAVWKA